MFAAVVAVAPLWLHLPPTSSDLRVFLGDATAQEEQENGCIQDANYQCSQDAPA